MKNNKVLSFTLAELLIVMVITAIVAGLAFAVLRLVQKQVYKINDNLEEANAIALFEQRLWFDLNTHHSISFRNSVLLMGSDIDTVQYAFTESGIFREKDSLGVVVKVTNFYHNGEKVNGGLIDAIKLEAETQGPPSVIFVSVKEDAVQYMNRNGF